MIGEGGRGALRLQGWFVKLALGWGGGSLYLCSSSNSSSLPHCPLLSSLGGGCIPLLPKMGGLPHCLPSCPRRGIMTHSSPKSPLPPMGGGSL